MPWIEDSPHGCRINIRVTPRSSRSHVDGCLGDVLKIRLAAPPVEGKANEALIEFLADELGLHRRSVQLEAGTQSRLKRILVLGMSRAEAARRLGQS